MKKALCMAVVMGMALVVAQSALADAVGGKFAETEAFRKFVTSQKSLEERDAALNAELTDVRHRLEHPRRDIRDEVWDWLLSHEITREIQRLEDETFYLLVAASLLIMPFYLFFLVRFNPTRFRLMTSARTLGRLWRKIKCRNGLASVLVLAGLGVVVPSGRALADTGVLQDITMYYMGSAFEKGYVACKYDTGDIALGYAAVNGVAVIERPATEFARAYDVTAHLLGLGLGVTADDLAKLYGQAKADEQRALVLTLLAKTGKDVAREGATQIIEILCSRRGQNVGVAIEGFKALLAAFADSSNRLMANSLVRQFLEKSVSRIKDLAGLDSLVDLAVDNDAFEIIREATAAAMKPLPSRLPFADAVYAGSIQFKLDKDMARNYFQTIRFDLGEFLRSEAVSLKLARLMRELSSVAAFLPLYDNDALYSALRRLPNERRVAMAGFFDSVSPTLGAVAYNSIGMEPWELVFSDPGKLILLARLTGTYKKDAPADFLNALKRAVVEYEVPYSKEQLFEAVEKVGQNPPGFVESVLTQDMNTDCRSMHNGPLLFSLIQSLSPEQLKAFESYFIKKSDLREEILGFLHATDKEVFNRVLAALFVEDAQQVAHMEFKNDIMDLGAVAPAFSRETLAAFTSLPAPYFVANTALSGQTPDVALAARALTPAFDGLFESFLSKKDKELSEKEAVTGMILLTLAQRPGVTAFAKEALILEKMLTEYFVQAKHGELVGQVERKKDALAQAKTLMARRDAERTRMTVTVINLGVMVGFGLVAMLFSLSYGMNIIMPGRDFSLLGFVVNAAEALGFFAMATVWLFPAGLFMVLACQILRGATRTDTLSQDMLRAVDYLRDGEDPKVSVPETVTAGCGDSDTTAAI